MYMIAAERVSSPPPQRPATSRSPFARLRELLDSSPPGLPAISLAVGEPQPAVPSFVGPVPAAHCEPVYLPATAATGFLPDLDSLPDELLARTVAFYLASPANPQGSVAEPAYFARLAALARRFGFLLFSDECYSEIYTQHAPA